MFTLQAHLNHGQIPIASPLLFNLEKSVATCTIHMHARSDFRYDRLDVTVVRPSFTYCT